jgi:hypothetical protein
LQDEPWDVLPPEVVHHDGEEVAYVMTALPEDTDPDAADVE